MPLVSTVGAANANSYVSLAEAEDYFATRLDVSAWENAEEAGSGRKERALMAATRILDRQNYLGYPATTTQRLKWPRAAVRKADSSLVGGDGLLGAGALTAYRTGYGLYAGGGGDAYPSDVIPQPLKDATCELAYALLAEEFTEANSEGLKSFSADGHSFSFRNDRPAGALPAPVMELISPLLEGDRLRRA
jgi:hypothetical protein